MYDNKLKLPKIVVDKWEPMTRMLAKTAGAHCAAVMRMHPDNLEILAVSLPDEVLFTGKMIPYVPTSDIYCLEVCRSGKTLMVSDARQSHRWRHSESLKAGFVAYMGAPIIQDDGTIFGSICLFDKKPNNFSDNIQDVTERFADTISTHLSLLCKNTELENAMKEIRTLEGLIPICANCKKMRSETGFWEKVELYIEKRSGARFSHGICEECSEKLYGGEKWYKDQPAAKKIKKPE